VFGDPGFGPSFPVGFSRDLSIFAWLSKAPLTAGAPPEGEYALYRRDRSGRFTLLSPVGTREFRFLRMSDDGNRVVFTSEEHLHPADASRTQGVSIYELIGADLRLVDVDQSGEELSPCGASIAERGAVSRSARRIFFASTGPSCSGPSRVYLREASTTTVEIGKSQCTRPDCGPERDVAFAGATPTGSKAFLISGQQLTDADTDEARDLYSYDVEGGGLALLSSATEAATGQVHDQAVVTSSDGDLVYFFASGQLIPGQGAEADSNLYLADGTELSFLATLPTTPLHGTVTGSSLLLATSEKLVEADTDGHADVYRYDAADGAFSLLSRGPSGGNGPFDASLTTTIEGLSIEALGRLELNPFSADGGRAFFTTTERLVPDDLNESSDVYEWADGRVELLSSGRAATDTPFAGASAGGETVLFETSASLIPEDRDGGEFDYYAARLGGGFADPPSQTGCGADRCATEVRQADPTRPSPSSLHRPREGRRRLRLGPVSAAAGDQIARTGTATFVAFVPDAGVVRAWAWTSGGSERRTLASGRAGAIRPGRVKIRLRFRSSVRHRLRRGLGVRLRLELRQGDLHERANVRLTASGPR
jgi:hypothetical protein